MSKDVGEKCGKRADGRRPGRTDGRTESRTDGDPDARTSPYHNKKSTGLSIRPPGRWDFE